MHRFYYPESFSKKEIKLSDAEEIHHLKNVLRAKVTEDVVLFNNSGEALCSIQKITTNNIYLHIKKLTKNKNHIKPYIILACAVPKKGKFETIIEKATELGVDEIIPLKTHRTELKLDKKRLETKHKRFETVALNATKQCKRLSIPHIHPVMDFKELFKHFKPKTKVFIPALTENRTNLFEALQKTSNKDSIAFCIGPEGDFTPQEYLLAQSNKCIPVSLGPNVLKVETAALCSLACVHAYF